MVSLFILGVVLKSWLKVLLQALLPKKLLGLMSFCQIWKYFDAIYLLSSFNITDISIKVAIYSIFCIVFMFNGGSHSS